MIFVAAGTQDGRELAGYLLNQGYDVTASVISQYGQSLLKAYQGIKINDKPLDESGLTDYLRKNGVKCFVDASHPYAANISSNAMAACKKCEIPYIRFEREVSQLKYDKAYYVADYKSAAKKAGELGENIFLTTGSRTLSIFSKADELVGCRLICRILPEAEVVKGARELGFTPDNIIAMQGPFSRELNRELFVKYNADVVVTKNSGSMGGTDTKFEAARDLELPLVIIDRPKMKYTNIANSFQDILSFVRENV
ncbi:MAG: cobalt-precorrin-6A reductase [Anaerovibrio sp.]|uniref:cobalt-precorrin-6A reductase n=1 Tax=Anaerovibrio sp. TaxID=1872532 RepID=UPI0025DF6D69|nr:cobalt-precorrin-6A reductase [Anaerovibrio sp.]MCR5177253.1 cobalt-precorrin-6A reductase [Anaerovibrio sp.]